MKKDAAYTSIYIPHELHAALKKRRDINMSAVCRKALRTALGIGDIERDWLFVASVPSGERMR